MMKTYKCTFEEIFQSKVFRYYTISLLFADFYLLAFVRMSIGRI